MPRSGRAHVLEAPSTPGVRWRVVEIDARNGRARVAPYLEVRAIATILDGYFGVEGWGNRFQPMSAGALVCELEIDGLSKSAVVAAVGAQAEAAVDAEALAGAALTASAALHGLDLPFDPGEEAWVPWDADAEAPLAGRDAGVPPHEGVPSGEPVPPDAAGSEAVRPPGMPSEAPGHAPIRSEGQQAIDKLMDRLREAGLGFEAAKLVNQHQGYGHDADAARELYARLRQLLLDARSA